MFKKLFDKTKEAVNQIDFKEAFENARDTTSNQFAKAKEWTGSKYEEVYPKIENVIVRGLVDLSEETLKDEEAMRRVLYQIIDKALMTLNILPGGGFLRETGRTFFLDKMVDYCQTHREPLLAKVQQYKTEKSTQADLQYLELEAGEANSNKDVNKNQDL